MLTQEQIRALLQLCNDIIEVVKNTGEHGAPAGVMYAAMMEHITLEQFDKLMGMLVDAGQLRRSDDLYFYVEPTERPSKVAETLVDHYLQQQEPRRTRFWSSDQGSATSVQFRTDAQPMVYLHTNMGWVAIGNTPKDAAEAEKFAAEIAEGYELTERSATEAWTMAGWDLHQ